MNGGCFIIVLNFNNKTDSLNCLESLRKFRGSFNIVFIDNGSTDRSVAAVKEKFPTIKVIENKKNLGFAAGNNIGIQYALENNAETVLLLNNDTIVPIEGIRALLKNSGDIVGAVLKFKRGKKIIYDLGGHINWWTGRATHKEVNLLSALGPRKPDYISGAAMLIRRKVFDKIGFLDSRYFLYYEDVDFCTRAKRAGFTVAIEPKIIISHKLGATADHHSLFSLYHNLRSNLLFINKNLVWYKKPIGWTYWFLLTSKVILNWISVRWFSKIKST